MSKHHAPPWADYLDARARLIHEWKQRGIPGRNFQGLSTEDHHIAAELNHHDPIQIKLISMTPLEPPGPGTSRARIAELEATLDDIARGSTHELVRYLLEKLIAAERGSRPE